MADIYAFLDLQGIQGESKDSEFTDKIELQSFSWGSSNNSSFRHGTGSGIGAGNVADIQGSKFTDKASLNLMLYCVQGKVIPSGTLTLLKLEGTTKLKYFEVKMTNIVVTAWSMGASGDGQLPSENFSLHFVKHEATYQPQADEGTASGAVTFNWDAQKKTA